MTEMKRTHRIVTAAVASLTLVGVAGGGIAWASAEAGAPSTQSSASSHCGRTDGTHAPMDAAARYLGLERAELLNQLRDGRSLAEIAEAQGRSVAGLEAVMERERDTMMGSGSPMFERDFEMDLDDMGSGMMNGSGAGMMHGSGAGMMGR
jgi:cytochrome c553